MTTWSWWPCWLWGGLLMCWMFFFWIFSSFFSCLDQGLEHGGKAPLFLPSVKGTRNNQSHLIDVVLGHQRWCQPALVSILHRNHFSTLPLSTLWKSVSKHSSHKGNMELNSTSQGWMHSHRLNSWGMFHRQPCLMGFPDQLGSLEHT